MKELTQEDEQVIGMYLKALGLSLTGLKSTSPAIITYYPLQRKSIEV